MKRRQGAHFPFPGHWARRWVYHWVCDAWPVHARPAVIFPTTEVQVPYTPLDWLEYNGIFTFTWIPPTIKYSRPRKMVYRMCAYKLTHTTGAQKGLLISCLFVPQSCVPRPQAQIKTRNSSGDEIAKCDARFACLTTPFLFNPLGGGDPLDDLRDFWWVSCRMARLQYGAKISPKS